MEIKSGTRRKKSGTRGRTSPADLTRVGGTRREFRSRAYRQAVWSRDEISPDLGEPFDEMLGVPGIGAGIARLISEFRETGAIENSVG